MNGTDLRRALRDHRPTIDGPSERVGPHPLPDTSIPPSASDRGYLSSPSDRQRAAMWTSNHDLDYDTIADLADDPDPQVRASLCWYDHRASGLAGGPRDLPPWVLEQLLNDADEVVRHSAACTPLLPADLRDYAWEWPSNRPAMALRRTDLTDQQWLDAVSSPMVDTRRSAAANPHLPVSWQRWLCDDPDSGVLHLLAANNRLDPHVIDALVDGPTRHRVVVAEALNDHQDLDGRQRRTLTLEFADYAEQVAPDHPDKAADLFLLAAKLAHDDFRIPPGMGDLLVGTLLDLPVDVALDVLHKTDGSGHIDMLVAEATSAKAVAVAELLTDGNRDVRWRYVAAVRHRLPTDLHDRLVANMSVTDRARLAAHRPPTHDPAWSSIAGSTSYRIRLELMRNDTLALDTRSIHAAWMLEHAFEHLGPSSQRDVAVALTTADDDIEPLARRAADGDATGRQLAVLHHLHDLGRLDDHVVAYLTLSAVRGFRR